MKRRFFHLYADHKTVKEISFEQWQKIAGQEMLKTENIRLIAKVDDTEVYFRKGRAQIWVPMVQLKQVLGEES